MVTSRHLSATANGRKKLCISPTLALSGTFRRPRSSDAQAMQQPHGTIPSMGSADGGGSNGRLSDIVAGAVAMSTGQTARYHRTWEEELGDSTAARTAAAAWRAWDIEAPAVLLRAEWFGGQVARFYDWMNPPNPRMRELFGVTYLDIAREEWWGLEWHLHVEFLQKLMASGLSPSEAASVLRVSQKLSRGRRLNTAALVRTSTVFVQAGFPVQPRNIWILQDATVAQIKQLHAAVFFSPFGRNERFNKRLSKHVFRRFIVHRKFKVGQSRRASVSRVTFDGAT